MAKVLNTGKIVILLTGRYAGKKAVIIKMFNEGSKSRRFGHALVAGIERAPRQVTKAMSEARIAKRIKIKPFVKYVNFNHLMPTRYVLKKEQFDFKSILNTVDSQSGVKKTENEEKIKDPLQNSDFRISLRKDIKRQLEEKYKGINMDDESKETLLMKFLYKPIRF